MLFRSLAFNRMIEDCYAGKIDLIITKSISRFARNTVDCLAYVRKMKAIGVEIFFEKENIYSFDSKMELILTLLSSIAQEESRNISENSKWGIRKRMRDGVPIVNCSRFLGYDKDENGQLVINENEAEVVRKIYFDFLAGKGMNSICEELEKLNILTGTGGKKWYVTTLRKILSNEKYYGELLLQKTVTVDYLTKSRVVNKNLEPQYRVENNHEAIIDKETWDLVQKEMARRADIYVGKDKDRSKYCKRYGFSHKLVCAECGRTYQRKHWNCGKPNYKIIWESRKPSPADGENAHHCTPKNAEDAIIKAAFLKVYNEQLDDRTGFYKAFIQNVGKVISDDESTVIELTEKIADLEETQSGLINLKIRGDIDNDDYAREYAKVKRAIEDLKFEKDNLLKTKLQATKDIGRVNQIKEIVGDGSNMLEEFDDDLFDTLVAKVILFSEMEFEFVFENGMTARINMRK